MLVLRLFKVSKYPHFHCFYYPETRRKNIGLTLQNFLLKLTWAQQPVHYHYLTLLSVRYSLPIPSTIHIVGNVQLHLCLHQFCVSLHYSVDMAKCCHFLGKYFNCIEEVITLASKVKELEKFCEGMFAPVTDWYLNVDQSTIHSITRDGIRNNVIIKAQLKALPNSTSYIYFTILELLNIQCGNKECSLNKC